MANLTYSQEFAFPDPEKETEVVPCSRKQWRRYMQRIRNCGDVKLDWHQAFGWASVGFAGSTLITAITLPLSVTWTVASGTGTAPNMPAIIIEVALVVATLAAVVIAINSLYYSWKAGKNATRVLSIILEDMEELERAYFHHDEAAAPAAPGSQPQQAA